jgi:hypothetical protein
LLHDTCPTFGPFTDDDDDDKFRTTGLYVIAMIGKEIKEIFSLLWQLQIFNVNAMFENENGEILVKTFLPFSRGNCNNTKPILINRFKDGKFENGIENFFPEKMKNLHVHSYCGTIIQ